MENTLHSADWLRQKYLVEELSTYDIAKIVGCDPKTVYSWVKKFGIPTRPRGLNLKGQDNYMAQEGVVNPFSGKQHSLETRTLLSEKAIGRPGLSGKKNPMYGKRGEKHHNWRGGKTPAYLQGRQTAEYVAWRNAVIARDGKQCRLCGRTDRYHAHHLLPYTKYPELAFDVHNGMILCPTCHNKLDGRGRDSETGQWT